MPIDAMPEPLIRRALYAAGVRGWRLRPELPGSPELAFTRWQVAVFVDWSGRSERLSSGRLGSYGDAKIARAQGRDGPTNVEFAAAGWAVVRLWDFQVREDLGWCVRQILDALEAAGRPVVASRADRAMSSARDVTSEDLAEAFGRAEAAFARRLGLSTELTTAVA